ncbi:hypothetical protein WN51_01657 [Melipona quadrifasciata]|uniref:Uncharacterized protein n=1 Tax=Melipona quadrifasciata TaxID=166423 RepID=A0A0N0BE48_9HYME|nr:hypothetical protein WN51_01657 [Melipona quadrifasciata]
MHRNVKYEKNSEMLIEASALIHNRFFNRTLEGTIIKSKNSRVKFNIEHKPSKLLLTAFSILFLEYFTRRFR